MGRGAGAVLAACGALLALAARAQDACTYVYSGYLTGLPTLLPATYLTPGLADWKVAVPVPAECAGGTAAGYEAMVCDHGAQPRVRVGRSAVRVRRAPPLAGYATVQLTVYCTFPYMLPAPPNMLPAISNRAKNLAEPPLSSKDDLVLSSTELLSAYDEEYDEEYDDEYESVEEPE